MQPLHLMPFLFFTYSRRLRFYNGLWLLN